MASGSRRTRLHQYAEEVAANPGIVARAVKHVAYHIDKVYAALPSIDEGFSDTPLAAGSSAIAVPDPCLFTVTHSAAIAFVEVTLPQNRIPATQQTAQLITVNNPNALLGAIMHRLQSSSQGMFSAADGVRTYQPTAAAHVTWPDANTFWRIQSSFDGKNFNRWSAPVRSNP